ncbi:NUDIX domain-containing protein [Haladaptatus sp. DYSN1]|uniref:NUDIX hydrolase n=1 Tax=unclassified Haladaptatus TaxID=2622732 RepID=UPI002404CCC7|nr:NUDIX domain-containing protein [Haladaptatus sp. DYSN1]
MISQWVDTVPKACAYITREVDGTAQLLVFHEPGVTGLQVPKGTVEPAESPFDAVVREVAEESGLTEFASIRPLGADTWTREKADRLKHYRRYFFHLEVEEPRDSWDHVVTGTGEEVGEVYSYSWVPLPTAVRLSQNLHAQLSKLF